MNKTNTVGIFYIVTTCDDSPSKMHNQDFPDHVIFLVKFGLEV